MLYPFELRAHYDLRFPRNRIFSIMFQFSRAGLARFSLRPNPTAEHVRAHSRRRFESSNTRPVFGSPCKSISTSTRATAQSALCCSDLLILQPDQAHFWIRLRPFDSARLTQPDSFHWLQTGLISREYPFQEFGGHGGGWTFVGQRW
jgi:hypothetical protein